MAKRILNVAVAEAFDAVGGGENIAVADGILEIYADLSASSVSLLGDPVRAQDVLEFNETSHAAGTAQVSAIIFAGTVVADTAYRIVLKYNGLEDFDQNFRINNAMFNDFLAYAEEMGVAKDAEGIRLSGDRIKTLMKAFIARNLYDDDGFYPIYHRIDETFLRAMEYLTVSPKPQ